MTVVIAPSCCAIIPARGGSKGIPRKNLVKVGGLPLVALTIRAARNAKSVGHVVVSTDDKEIAEVAANFGADIVIRPPELANDTASSESALLHALDDLGKRGIEPETVVFLQCTSPFTSPADIDGTVNALLSSQADAAFSGASTHAFLWRQGRDGEVVPINHERDVRQRRQDRAPEFVETGAVYAMRLTGFRKSRHRFFGKVVVHAVDPERAIEIDSPQDLQRVRALFPLHYPMPSLFQRVQAVILDFDGVLTDNRVFVDQNGIESVVCDRGDGFGIEKLRHSGVPVIVLSKEVNPVVTARCAKLKVEVVQGIENKLAALDDWLVARGISRQAAAYIGNDANDVECLEAVGFSMTPNDAHVSAMRVADWVLGRPGGRGAVREACDIVLTQVQSAAAGR